MHVNIILFFLAVLAVAQVAADLDENSAKLLLYKSTTNDAVVEGRDFSVTYQIINVGNAAATSIEVSDRYDAASFEPKSNVNEEGNVEFELDQLVPGGQTTFNVTVRPKLFGIYESTRARIKYGNGAVEMEGVDPEFRGGFSTSLGRIKIESASEFERRTSMHVREYGLFGLVFGIPTMLAFTLWRATSSISSRISRPKGA